jgi:hypothetical protein
MNQDYHMFFVLRNMPDGHQWGLHSAVFYFLASARALWEEHRVVHELAKKGQRASREVTKEKLTIPHFILLCAQTLSAELNA